MEGKGGKGVEIAFKVNVGVGVQEGSCEAHTHTHRVHLNVTHIKICGFYITEPAGSAYC